MVHDLDDPRGQGAQWGEVQANIHRALGCVGVVTDGSVRDLDEVRALGFQFCAAHVSVSHANVHMVDFGMQPMDAIQSATSRAATMLDMDGQIGAIVPGAFADIIAVNGDPLRDLKTLENVSFVMKDGQVFRGK